MGENNSLDCISEILRRDIENAKAEIKKSMIDVEEDIIHIKQDLNKAKTAKDIANVKEQVLYSLECVERILSSNGILYEYVSTRSISEGLWEKAGYDKYTVDSIRKVSKMQFQGYQNELNELLEDIKDFSPSNIEYPDSFQDMFVSEDAFFIAVKWLEKYEYLKDGTINNAKIKTPGDVSCLFWTLIVLGYTKNQSSYRDIESVSTLMGSNVSKGTIGNHRLTEENVNTQGVNRLFYTFPKYGHRAD